MENKKKKLIIGLILIIILGAIVFYLTGHLGSYKDIDYISLKDTIENQKSAGLTCKEK